MAHLLLYNEKSIDYIYLELYFFFSSIFQKFDIPTKQKDRFNYNKNPNTSDITMTGLYPADMTS